MEEIIHYVLIAMGKLVAGQYLTIAVIVQGKALGTMIIMVELIYVEMLVENALPGAVRLGMRDIMMIYTLNFLEIQVLECNVIVM